MTLINSNGVRCWILFLQKFTRGRQVRLEECSPDVVEQMTMIPTFYLACEVASIVGLYECQDCNQVREEVIVPKGGKAQTQTLLPVICPKCTQGMDLDECTEDFLQFFTPIAAAR